MLDVIEPHPADAFAEPPQAVEHRRQDGQRRLLALRLQDPRLVDVLHAEQLHIDAGDIADGADGELQQINISRGDADPRLLHNLAFLNSFARCPSNRIGLCISCFGLTLVSESIFFSNNAALGSCIENMQSLTKPLVSPRLWISHNSDETIPAILVSIALAGDAGEVEAVASRHLAHRAKQRRAQKRLL